MNVGDISVRLYPQGKNLTDDEQRKHTSVVKDLVPEPGRTIEAGVGIRVYPRGGYGPVRPV